VLTVLKLFSYRIHDLLSFTLLNVSTRIGTRLLSFFTRAIV